VEAVALAIPTAANEDIRARAISERVIFLGF
jgi:Flp pilus assembly protein protease CpaA